jgi:ATP-dependent DNA helicase RecQ
MTVYLSGMTGVEIFFVPAGLHPDNTIALIKTAEKAKRRTFFPLVKVYNTGIVLSISWLFLLFKPAGILGAMMAGDYTGAAPEQILKKVFGYESFRPLQKEIITTVLAGRDTLAVMPTGGGKSVCYQIPALLFPGLTVVVSPLIALMEDQVASLHEMGVNAVFLNSSLEWEQYKAAMNSIRCGETKIVYVSPEGLATARIQDLLHEEQLIVSCITIDEAHCVSEWGHDFRPDYLEIAAVRKQFPGAVCLALTATATKQVRDAIVDNLALRTPALFVASFNRPNIYLEVKRKAGGIGQIIDYIGHHRDESGIVYCFSRKQVDLVTDGLSDAGYSVLNYHAGLSDEVRADHQRRFIRDEVSVMVATVAFGMGIDKPNVRYVIHYDLPKSVEQYYQEIGRAGRDGLPARALLLYSAGDIHKIRYFFEECADTENAEKLLQSMISYVTARTCRRQVLLRYFGENFDESPDCCCDICSAGPLPAVDMTVPAQKMMSCIIRTGSRYGSAYIIDVLLGSRLKRIVDNGHTQISTWGIGKELKKEEWFEVAAALVDCGYLIKSEEYGVLSLSETGCSLLRNREKIDLPVVFPGISFKQVPAAPSDDAATIRIAEALKKWRRRMADSLDVPPYVIFGDRTLTDIAEKKPADEYKLRHIYGIGEIKVQRFGREIIEIVTGC